MLESTFIHVPGVGPKTERSLWEQGIVDWECFVRDYRGSRREGILPFLNHGDVIRLLPGRDKWRLCPTFRDSTAYVDIETTGLTGSVTCIGLYDGQAARTFVRGRDLEEFPAAIQRYELIVTFNGSQFDLPILARTFPGLSFEGQHHLDLRFALGRLGLRGGLKKIEQKLGIGRGEVEGLDGWAAVVLWRLHCQGHRKACQTLERYCLEDVLNLEPLLCHLYNTEIARIPFLLPRMEPRPEPVLAQQVDKELVDRLAKSSLEW